ncbi:MAG: hypothetical protein HOA02_08110, partial [Planctomycetes bacterium]|nr:hypothetical protein [Planctomycetota bacterium]
MKSPLTYGWLLLVCGFVLPACIHVHPSQTAFAEEIGGLLLAQEEALVDPSVDQLEERLAELHAAIELAKRELAELNQLRQEQPSFHRASVTLVGESAPIDHGKGSGFPDAMPIEMMINSTGEPGEAGMNRRFRSPGRMVKSGEMVLDLGEMPGHGEMMMGRTGMSGRGEMMMGRTGMPGHGEMMMGRTGMPGRGEMMMGRTGMPGHGEMMMGRTGMPGHGEMMMGRTGMSGRGEMMMGRTGMPGHGEMMMGRTGMP